MTITYFVTHPEVTIEPSIPVPDWGLSNDGFGRIEAFCHRDLLDNVTDVFVSDERKVLDCARALKRLRGKDFKTDRDLLDNVTDVFVSDERKVLDCARALKRLRGKDFKTDRDLRENDRSSTGYIAPPRFWEIVDDFFAYPSRSILGWERSSDAQARIREAIRRCIASRSGQGDIVFFFHGGVGTLLLCDVLGRQIARAFGQPIDGAGCFFSFETETLPLLQSWEDIVPAAGCAERR